MQSVVDNMPKLFTHEGFERCADICASYLSGVTILTMVLCSPSRGKIGIIHFVLIIFTSASIRFGLSSGIQERTQLPFYVIHPKPDVIKWYSKKN